MAFVLTQIWDISIELRFDLGTINSKFSSALNFELEPRFPKIWYSHSNCRLNSFSYFCLVSKTENFIPNTFQIESNFVQLSRHAPMHGLLTALRACLPGKLLFWIQWESELQTSSVFKWSKIVCSLNGLLFRSWLE